MTTRDLSQTNPTTLARLLNPDTLTGRDWRADELSALLRHQLATPLTADLANAAPDAQQTLAAVTGPLAPALRTFGDLFRQPQPPLALLQLTKQFGKNHRQDPTSPLPAEIATIIYFASIVLARLRCRQSISDLEPQALHRGIQWALAQPWLDDSLRRVFQEAQQLKPADE